MMDQIVTTLNGGAPVEARDTAKARNDKPANGKGGFGDTLSSVKNGQQPAPHDEKMTPDQALQEPSADPADEADHLAHQRKASLQAKAALGLAGQKPTSVKEAMGDKLDEATRTDRLVLQLKGDETDEVSTKATSVADLLSTEIGETTDGEEAGGLAPDASLADMVASLLVTAEAASSAGPVMQSDKPAKAQDSRDLARADKVTSKTGEKAAALREDALAMPDDDLGLDLGSDSDATYRFNLNKGGTPRSMDMAVRSAQGRIDFDVKESTGRITENVTVLDSRRFLGLASPTNSSSIAGLIASDADWMSALRPDASLSNAAAHSSTGKLVHTLKLQLKPADLGSVTMSLRMVGEQLAVHMTVDNVAALRKLQDDNRAMMDALKAHGITVDQITISVSAAEKSDQMQGQLGGQAGNGTMAKFGDENGNGAGPRTRQGEASNAGGHDANAEESDHDAAATGGGVYL